MITTVDSHFWDIIIIYFAMQKVLQQSSKGYFSIHFCSKSLENSFYAQWIQKALILLLLLFFHVLKAWQLKYVAQ